MRIRAGLAAAFIALLAACETTEGYRQQMSAWQGRMSDDLILEWGEPVSRSTLSDGRQVWSYDRETEWTSGGYYRDETRQVTRTIRDSSGRDVVQTVTETFPVYQPPTTNRTTCTTRFVLSTLGRVQEVRFEGDGCVAPERNP